VASHGWHAIAFRFVPEGKLERDRVMQAFSSLTAKTAALSRNRQREGIARAKAEGKYRGRVPTAQRKGPEVVQLRSQGIKPEEIAVKLGIGRASVFMRASFYRWDKDEVPRSVQARPRAPAQYDEAP